VTIEADIKSKYRTIKKE
jgi:Ran GTPase-activating protein (RanGAP) involved in mRNA processing and transport